MQLEGKRVLITGGGRGIGKAVAIAFAREGADICVSARSSDQIDAVAAEVNEIGRKGMALVCDIADPPAVRDMVDAAVDGLGGLDILVNNAGGAIVRKPVVESDPGQWKSTVDINLLGTYYCTRAALPHMILSGRGGKIINVGSGMGHTARPNNTAYNVAKAGMWMFTRCLALEVWEHGIEVNELIPGPVYTELTQGYFEPPGGNPPPIAPSERVKTPEECVPLAMFLAAHPPGGPTGQSFSLARRPL